MNRQDLWGMIKRHNFGVMGGAKDVENVFSEIKAEHFQNLRTGVDTGDIYFLRQVWPFCS